MNHIKEHLWLNFVKTTTEAHMARELLENFKVKMRLLNSRIHISVHLYEQSMGKDTCKCADIIQINIFAKELLNHKICSKLT